MRLEHPYGDLNDGKWLRGNLHAHTTASDGKRSAQAVIDDYAQRGYDFLMISDHDIFTGGKEYSSLDPRGMVLIPGNEISARGPHMLHVNATGRVEPDADRQKVINDSLANGGFIVANHPNWQETFNHCSQEKLESWTGYTGMEIYNGVIGRLSGSPYATNKWDMLLTKGKRVWGFANDDSHAEVDDVELGWNMVYAKDKSVNAIVDAMSKGRFYPSTGVKITGIHVDGMKVRIETENAEKIVALREVGCRIASTKEKSLEVEVPSKAHYVRFECWGRGESFAWSQPFFPTK